MTVDRLPESLQTLYAELFDQVVQAEAEAAAVGLPPAGSFVSKSIRGRIYWYLQRSEGTRKRQIYLGAETPALLRWMDDVRERRHEREPDEERRAEIVAMLVAGGAFRERAAIGRVLRILTSAGLFRLGAVLVGTQAFTAYCNMLGVRFASQMARTEGVDVAQQRGLAIALDPSAVPLDLVAALREADPRFLAVPSLDRRSPSTSFKVRGRDLRVDFLTPQRGRDERPVRLPHLGAAAQPLPFLGYLLSAVQPAVVLEGSGLLVNVPEPARFAFHKLWLASERPAAEQTKAAKDVRQAGQLVEALIADRPEDLGRAWRAVGARRRRQVLRGIERLDRALRDELAVVVDRA